MVGLMSGTSADGVDAVVASISRASRLRAVVVAHYHRKFSPGLRRRILNVSTQGSVEEICELNFELGHLFGSAALEVICRAKLKPKQISAVASHGQTIHHLPDARFPSTLQIGEPAVIAAKTGILTIGDFRVADMAVGGLGAPLVAYADWALLTHSRRPRIVQNIGGIANLTFLPANADCRNVFAFDTGPGNMVIDGVINEFTRGKLAFDRNGDKAARGKVSQAWLLELMRHPFLSRFPPKTTGREEFGVAFVKKAISRAKQLRISAEDVVATVTEFTCESICQAYRRFVFPKLNGNERKFLQIIVGGGGAKNPVLMKSLKQKTGCEVLTHEDFGIDNKAKEALAFAILGYETMQGRPSNVPGATGAARPAVLGKIAQP